MEAISIRTLLVVEGDSVTIEFKVAVDSDGHTWKDPYLEFASDLTTRLNFRDCYPKLPQHYCHTIERVDRTHEGIYTAKAESMCADFNLRCIN